MYAPQARPGALDSARRSSGDAGKLKQVRSDGSVLLQDICGPNVHSRMSHRQHIKVSSTFLPIAQVHAQSSSGVLV